MARFNFDTADYEEESQGGGDFPMMPNGEYLMMCTESEERSTKAGTGKFIACTFEVVDGEYTGRKVWFNFNVENPSAKAESIGRGQVRAWAKACGLPDAEDTESLTDVTFSCVLGVEKGTGGYPDKNGIKKFIDPNEDSGISEKVASKKPAAGKAPKPAAPTGGSGGNPWA